MNSKLITSLIQGFVVTFCLLLSLSCGGAAENCEQSVGRLVSIQGVAQVQRNGQSGWQVVTLDGEFCPGDTLRILTNGRAAVVLRNETVLRIDQKSTINFNIPPEDKSLVIELLHGILHIFSHRPRSLKVVTPYVNGVVEGTEFLVRADVDASVITVFEGRVAAFNQQGQLDLSSGQSARATRETAPKVNVVVKPRDAVEWTLYYPVIIESSPHTKDEKAESARQATASLTIGRVDEARASLAKILQNDPSNSEALALSAIIETVNNNKENASRLASRAVDSNPESASANLALSYTHQALFNIPAALEVLQQAAEFTPENSLVKARLAELFLAVGEFDKALAAAREAVSLKPGYGLSRTVLGFAYLSRIEIDEAVAAFNKAIMLDSASPLARLGLGLAKIRAGRLEEGRADIEIAAALDPGNALIRSYLGKAYFEEKRDSQARRQYEIAKQLDPADPTPWFYDAIRKQTINRPVEALRDIQQSITLNDNRAVYRSRLLLDDDLAVRSAGLGRIYSDLGFQQLALVEGWKSVQSDPANYSAHRFLADTYSALPRHEIARISELLRSQLLQPLNVTPVQPRLAEKDLTLLEDAGPSSLSFNEFNPLFLRDRIALQASGVAGSNDILGDELVVSGVEGRLSYSLGQFHYQTDGIRDNNDQEQDIYNLFFQGMLSPATSLMAEFRHREKDFGDLTLVFDPSDFSRSIRQSEEIKSVRVGIRHNLQPDSTLLGTVIIGEADGSAVTGSDDGFISTGSAALQNDNQMVELQHIYRGTWFNLQSGTGFLAIDETESFLLTFPVEIMTENDKKTEHVNIYSYGQIDLPCNFLATIGLSGDLLDSPVKDRERLNPKIGLTWQPLETTLIRAAVFRAVHRNLIYAQTLEPTLVAGFNQFFVDFPSSTAQTYGVGIDHSFSADIYGGLQYFHRDLDVPFTDLTSPDNPEPREDDWQEDIGSAYVYWAPAGWVTLGLEYYYEHFSHDRFEGPQRIRELTTHRVTPKLQFFHRSGLTAGLQVTLVDQEGEFGSVFSGFEEGSDDFWLMDLSVSYRLPKRFGIFKIEVNNLFDEKFQFLDTDPSNPRFLPEQQIIGSFTVAF
ncbi:MAG: tetratricopeptide repeat protein [Desulforhopalus sp.]